MKYPKNELQTKFMPAPQNSMKLCEFKKMAMVCVKEVKWVNPKCRNGLCMCKIPPYTKIKKN